MSFLTPRQRGLAVLVAALVLVSAVTALTGYDGWSLTVLAVLLGTACVLLLDIRHRQQLTTRSQQRLLVAVQGLEESLTELHARSAEIHARTGEIHARTGEIQARAGETTAAVRRTTAAVEELADVATARHAETTRTLADLDFEPVNEIQALLQLLPKVPGAPALPDVGGWALSASTLLAIWDVIEEERPTTIVECGSGTSTLWLCYAARAAGGARVVSLEHKAVYARRTVALLAKHGLQDIADVRHARMRETEVGGATAHWYDLRSLDDIDAIDLLVVDGPPRTAGPTARFPAVPLLVDKLAPGALIVMDDAGRPDEQETMRRWSEDYGVEVERRLSRDSVLLRR